MDPFFQNDRKGTPEIQKTINGLALLLPGLLKTPFVMTSGGTPSNPYIKCEAPYFQGAPVGFNPDMRPGKSFYFFIIANNFAQTFNSHALVGWWNGEILTIFDPNGDFHRPDPDSVYSGPGYLLAPQVAGLKNPLYNTLLKYFDKPKMNVYTGDPIPCPRGFSGSCMYRALMYIIALSKTSDPDEAVRYTTKLAKTNFAIVKAIADIAQTYVTFRNNSIKNQFTEIVNSINLNAPLTSPKYKSIAQRQPQPPRTQPLPPPPRPSQQRPGKRKKEAS